MKTDINFSHPFFRRRGLTVLALTCVVCIASTGSATERQKLRVNALEAKVRDREGHGLKYTGPELAAAGDIRDPARSVPNFGPLGYTPTGAAPSPFWRYTNFGRFVGSSNILVGPMPAGGGGPREIIVGGSGDFSGNDFWQVIRYNSTTGDYDQLFVSPIYTAAVRRILLGNVVGDSRPEIVVMLEDGRVYLYDTITKAEIGHFSTGLQGLEGFGLADLDGDGLAELIMTNQYDLFVVSNAGVLLWQVAGAGGYEVVVGQMDNDSALEIAATNGKVVDVGTHAVQWTRPGGFGYHLRLAPLPGASYQQLIAADESHVFAYDAAAQLSRWTIPVFDINTIEVADVDNDGIPEVIIGDDQFGPLHVHDLITQAEKWHINYPGDGFINIAVGDVDNDGVADILWGGQDNSEDRPHLYVASTTGAHTIKWQSNGLVGSYFGPLIGDLDGDGQPELVVFNGGRILVFDLQSLTLRAMSEELNAHSSSSYYDFKLADVDGDGRFEIVLAGERLYNGLIEIYGFDSSNTFALKWTNTTRPNVEFNFVDVIDLDGNGTNEIVVGTYASGSNSTVNLYIYDYPSGTDPWRSVDLAGAFNLFRGLVVDDIGGNGDKKIVALISTGDVYTFDGSSRALESVVHSSGEMIAPQKPSGLILVDDGGVGHFLQYSGSTYTESFTRQLGSERPDGINVLTDGALWVGTGGKLARRIPPSYDSVVWESQFFGPGCGGSVATDFRSGQTRVFTAAESQLAGFNYDESSGQPASLGNISTRLRVEAGENVLIGGLIVTGSQPKRILIRALGPSLANFGISDVLANPKLELRDSSGHLIVSNDDWRSDQQAEIIATTIPPSNDLESAIVATLLANNAGYTAIVRGVSNGTGIGVVEVYDLDRTADSKLGNISTRGLVQTGDNVLIAGTIVLGQATQRVLVRAIGPSLSVAGRLADPILELRDGNGALLQSNDNWRSDQEAEIIATSIPPVDDLESALIATLPASGAAYTAIVRGVNGMTGVAVVEVYDLD